MKSETRSINHNEVMIDLKKAVFEWIEETRQIVTENRQEAGSAAEQVQEFQVSERSASRPATTF